MKLDLERIFTLDNILKVLLAIAVGIMLYNVFFKKTETYYNYHLDKSGYAYPSDYETEMMDDVISEETEDLMDAMESADEDVVEDVVVDDAEDDAIYEYDEGGTAYDDAEDGEMVGEIPDEIYIESDNEDEPVMEDDTEYVVEDDAEDENVIDPVNAYDFLYAADVEDDLQENFVLYSNEVGVDATYQ
jgi:hypothetical protein